jgi:hypothetical protein
MFPECSPNAPLTFPEHSRLVAQAIALFLIGLSNDGEGVWEKAKLNGMQLANIPTDWPSNLPEKGTLHLSYQLLHRR